MVSGSKSQGERVHSNVQLVAEADFLGMFKSTQCPTLHLSDQVVVREDLPWQLTGQGWRCRAHKCGHRVGLKQAGDASAQH